MEINFHPSGIAELTKALLSKTLRSRYLALYIAVLAILLTLPSLKVGLLADDYWHRAVMTRSPVFAHLLGSPYDAFRFVDGDPERTHSAMDIGFLPWWTWPYAKGAFFRPLTSLTHWLDYTLWPRTPALMHAQSIFYYALLCAAVTILFRRLHLSVTIAALAAIIYSIDYNHTICASWLAARNATLATLFGVLALIAHDRWRRNKRTPYAAFACLALIASLLSAEAGIATCAFLFSYAVFIDTGPIRKRALTLVPYAVIAVLWRIAWTKLGYGIDGVEIYSDPVRNTAGFLSAVLQRAPILLLGQWALPPADIAILMSPRHIILYAALATIVLITIFTFFVPLLRRDRIARFWFSAMLLATIPISASFPTGRLLTFVGLAAAGLLAEFLHIVFAKSQPCPQSPLWRKPAIALAATLVFIHLIMSPAALTVSSRFPLGSDNLAAHFSTHLDLDPSAVAQTVIIVNPPLALGACYIPAVAEAHGTTSPRHTRILAPGYAKVTIYRPDANSLIVRPEYGFLAWVGDRIFRSSRYPFQLGEKVELTGFTAEVLEMTSDNRPGKVRFTFDVPLEDASLRWFQCRDKEFTPFTPPAIGQTAELDAQNLLKD